MRKRIAAVALACTLTACGGAGSSSPGAPAGGTRSTPTPPPALTTKAFHIIGPASVHAIVIAAAGAPVSVPAGFQLAGPVAGGVLTYPDGSTQVTDANGMFSPASAAYVQQHSITLQTSGVTQPSLKISGSSGAVGTANLIPLAAASNAPLAGVTLLPNAAEVFSGEAVVLSAAGTDADDRVAPLDTASITWSSAAGATIAAIGGTAQAVYIAPSGAAMQTDVVTATVHVAGSAAVYSATSHVTTIPAAAGYGVSGAIASASGSPLANASAVFLADDPPRVYPSFDFYAQADANGAYSRLLPANSSFGLAVLAPGATPAVLSGTTSTDLQTGNAGTNGIANLTASTGEYDDTKDDAKNAFPDPIVSVRDAWFAQELLRPYPFWADSGVLAVLAAPAVANAAPAPVGSGLFAQWCYQWQSRGGSNVLTIVENGDASCSSSGNDAFEITPQAAAGSYAFAEYRALSGGYALGGTLSASSGALLVATGSWQQSLSGTPAAPLGDTANVQISFYGPISAAASVAQLAFDYGYSANGTSAAMQISNAALGDSSAALTLATGSGSASRSAAASACVGVAASCYAGSASITRTYAGSATRAYQAQTAIDGDGSMSFTVSSANSGDASAVVVPVAGAQARAGGSCIVCSAAPGSLLDVDGQTRIGSFTVSAGQSVLFDLLDTQEGEVPGRPIDALIFPL